MPHTSATQYSLSWFWRPAGYVCNRSSHCKVAEHLKISATEIQQKNLLKSGDEFPYGQLAESEANECWNKAEADFQISKMQQDVADFNTSNTLFKKGIAVMPICFGISFTKTFMNQARSLVNVYTDGSVNISTAAVKWDKV